MDEFQLPPESTPAPDMGPLSAFSGMPAIHIPQPFNLSDPSNKEGLAKITTEIMAKEEHWENRMTPIFGEMEEYTDSWRIQSRRKANQPKALFNSKSGETHRATETLATLWFQEMTSSDPFFYAEGDGLNDFGQEVSDIELQSVEAVMRKQLQFIRFKEKLLRSLRSMALFGSMIVECPWTSFPYGDGEKYFEGTDFIHRPLLTTGFNPFVFDLDQSDYIFTLDYPTIQMIRNWCKNSPKDWDIEAVEKIYQDHKNINSDGGQQSQMFNRVIQRKQRAGYNVLESSNWELLTYHGRVDTEIDVVQKYWESEGRQDDPNMCDFTVGVLHGTGAIRFNATPFRSWHHLFKTAHSKLFEMEPLGYGVGKVGRKRQRELDATESRSNDLLMFNVLPMFKIGKYAGVDVSKLTMKPWNFVEMENIDQLEPIKANIEALPFSQNLQRLWREEFRAATGATGTLQGVASGGSATESAIVQNEGMRGAHVVTRIVGETFMREFLTTAHVNNTYLMDNGFWVKVMGAEKPFIVDRNNLPKNVGLYLKLLTDGDTRPDMLKAALEGLQIATSVRNDFPQAMNMIPALIEKVFRSLNLDIRLLSKPISAVDQMLYNMKVQAKLGQNMNPATDAKSEAGGAAAGGGGGITQTPVGPVETSPNPMPVNMSR